VFFARPQSPPSFSPQIFCINPCLNRPKIRGNKIGQSFTTYKNKILDKQLQTHRFEIGGTIFHQIGGTFFTNRRNIFYKPAEHVHQIGGTYSPNRRTKLYTKSAEHAQNIGQMKWGPDMFSSSIIAMGAQ
jgi:hypothetical protein